MRRIPILLGVIASVLTLTSASALRDGRAYRRQPAGQQHAPHHRRHRSAGTDADRRERHLERRNTDQLRLPVAAL